MFHKMNLNVEHIGNHWRSDGERASDPSPSDILKVLARD